MGCSQSKQKLKAVEGLERTYMKTFTLFGGEQNRNNVYCDFGLCFEGEFFNIRIQEVNAHQCRFKSLNHFYDIPFGLEVMQRKKKTWILKEDGMPFFEKRGWTFKVGALTKSNLKFFTLQINGRHYLELPQTQLELPGAGSNWDEVCAIGGHLVVSHTDYIHWAQYKL